jgi:arylsulfatase A-like enzyme
MKADTRTLLVLCALGCGGPDKGNKGPADTASSAGPTSTAPATLTSTTTPTPSPTTTTTTPPTTTVSTTTSSTTTTTVHDDSGERALVFDGPPPRNLLMISIDTMRRDHMSRYSGDGLTPFLDKIADEGVALDDLTQCSNWTFPGTTCTMMGRYNLESGFLPGLTYFFDSVVPDGTPFLAGWLGQAGFYSILKTTNHNFSRSKNNTQGYDHVEKMTVHKAERVWAGAMEVLDDVQAGADPPDRWFVHVHLIEPHEPYVPPGEYLEGLLSLPEIPVDLSDKDAHEAAVEDWDSFTPEEQENILAHMRVRYRGEIADLDQQLQDIWDDAEVRGLLDDALVVVWTDHGEQFFEHGNQRHAYHLHTEENDALGFFWAKNLRRHAWTEPATSTDIVPTILDTFALPMPPEVTGIPIGGAHVDRPRHALAVGRLGVLQSVRVGRHRMIYNWDGAVTFHDTVEDPTEQVNLFDPKDQRVLELWDLLEPKVLEAQPLVPYFDVNWPAGL